MNQHIEMPQIQYTDKVADDSIVIQRQISPRTTETKAPEHPWDDRSGGDSRIEISTLTKDQKSSQTRSIDSHEIQCEKEYEIDLRADTGTLSSRTRTRFRPSITENRSITNILVKARVNTQAKGKATT